jgi:methylglyoxal synthase
MANTFTVTLSDAELKALEFVALTADGWIQNAIHERCRIAMEEMVSQEVAAKLALGEPIAGSKEEIVMNSTLPSAAQRHETALAQIATGPIVTP